MGFPPKPPGSAQLGAPISPSQHETIERIEKLMMRFLLMPDFVGDDLGRAKEKFIGAIKSIQELPWCKLGLQDLTELALQVEATLDPYRSHFDHDQSRAKATAAEDPNHQCKFDAFQRTETVENPAGALPAQSDRVKWKSPPSFEAGNFLSGPLLKSAYEQPEVLRKPKDSWPKSKVAKVQCPKSEFIKLARRWDNLGACTLISAEEKNFEEAVGESFAVKVLEDSKELRQELEMLQSISHEHIAGDSVSYLGHEVHDKQLYIFLEYMPEGTLKDKIDEFGAFQEDRKHARHRCADGFRVLLPAQSL
eukprot:Skav204926  [mRNA]  locus=scaffold526:127715:133088:+ [translate_table: standard]